MIAMTSSGRRFLSLARYLLHGRSGEETERVAWTTGRNLGTDDPELAAALMQTIADQNVRVEGGEAWLIQVHISPYAQGNIANHDPERRRRLLLHRREIEYLDGKVRQQGLTLVPLRMYVKGNRSKLLIGLARGKKLWDKRQAMAERDSKREADRVAARH